MSDLYHQQILDLYQNPDNFGALDHPTHTISEGNASCGDEFTFFINLDQKGIIKEVSFTGHGCAISTASSSLLCQYLEGKPVSLINSLTKEKMEELIGVSDISIGRIKCLTLPLKAIQKLQLDRHPGKDV